MKVFCNCSQFSEEAKSQVSELQTVIDKLYEDKEKLQAELETVMKERDAFEQKSLNQVYFVL